MMTLPSVTPPRCFISLLPNELLSAILEFNWNRDVNRYGKSPFAMFSLVCSTWRPLAQKILFTEVHLRSVKGAESFLSAIKQNRALRKATRILMTAEPICHSRTVFLIRNITALCPRIYKIIFEATDVIDHNELLNAFHSRTFATLQALTFSLRSCRNDFFWKAPLTPESALAFLCKFSSLSHLRIEPLFEVTGELPEFATPPSFELYEFSFGGDRDQINRSRSLFGQACFRCFTGSQVFRKLEVLNIGDHRPFLDVEGKWPNFIMDHGSTLRSLCLFEASDSLLVHCSSLFKVCLNLQELKIPKSTLPPELRAILPVENLESLDFRQPSGVDVDQDMSELVDWIISLPKIRHVTFRFSRNSNHVRNHIKIWSRCTDSGIQTMLWNGLHDDIIETSTEDHIRTSHFPRSRTVSNIGKMVVPVN